MKAGKKINGVSSTYLSYEILFMVTLEAFLGAVHISGFVC